MLKSHRNTKSFHKTKKDNSTRKLEFDCEFMVIPDKIDDIGAFKLARDIRERIENEMTYPGQIKISVIREYRANEIAK